MREDAVRQAWRRLVTGLLAACLFVGPAAALDPERSIRQYKHTRWTRADGAPALIVDIDQSADGFLWLASRDGVFRFDGISFERVDTEVDLEMEGGASRVLVTKRGDVWISYARSGRFAVYRQGQFSFIPSPPRVGYVLFLLETHDGAIWAGHGEPGLPFLRYHQGRWINVDPIPGERDYLWSAVIAQDGALWASFRDHVVRLPPGATRFEHVETLPGRQSMLVVDRHGQLWSPSATDIRLLADPSVDLQSPFGVTPLPLPARSRRQHGVFDKDGNLWILNGYEGLERINGLDFHNPGRKGPLHAETFTPPDGLTGTFPNAILEDREGNIWVATTRGLDRFRDVSVAVEPSLNKSAMYGDRLFSASNGDIYIGEAGGVYRVRPHGDPHLLVEGIEPEAICEGPDRAIWVVFQNRAVRIDGTRIQTIARPPERETSIYTCGLDRWNRLWATAAGSGIYRWEASGWERIEPESPSDGFYPTLMAVDPKRSLWVRWGDTSLARMELKGQTIFPLPALKELGVRTMQATGQGVFFTANKGFARLVNGKLTVLGREQVPSLLRATGFVQTPQGETWSFGVRGLTRMKTADLERAFQDAGFIPPVRVFDFDDGLPDEAPAQSFRSLVQGGDGRLWLTTAAGAAWIDPSRLTTNPVPPGVAITLLVADGVRHRDPRSLQLAAGTSSVEIDFAAPSLAIPERVKVLYRLEGYDRDWIDPGRRRQAFYTNLLPGTYRFTAIAANRDGVWNRRGDTLEFTIPPTFVQSVWFKLLIALAVVALATLAYRLRMRQVVARMQGRFDIRIAERERIARELHDTLLQGIQGLMLRFQATANRIATPEMREALDDALERADAVLVEGRARVRDLRSTSESGELAQQLLGLAGRLVEDETPHVDLAVEGEPRSLHPLVQEEALRITEEAIRNVVSHADATRLDLRLIYGRNEFILRIRDNGVGISEAILSAGSRTGHFGLVGMRERAQQIGGRLHLASSEGTGTEVTLLVPARAAYSDRRLRLLTWFSLGRLGGRSQ